MIALALAIQRPVIERPPLYPHLAAEINQMAKVDQEVRTRWIEEMSKRATGIAETVKDMNRIDHDDTERMKWIVREFGWPTPEMVGKEASGNAWLLVQHADADRGFQKQCLGLIEPLARRGVIPGENYTYLYDRVQTGAGKLQRFGTQGRDENGLMWIQPVENPAKVDDYRRRFGMIPLEKYLTTLAEVYKEKVAPDWRERMKPNHLKPKN